jgi:hypothetical protein
MNIAFLRTVLMHLITSDKNLKYLCQAKNLTHLDIEFSSLIVSFLLILDLSTESLDSF